MKEIRNRSRNTWKDKLLQALNLRPEEGERTFFMFLFYTITSVGMLWLEQTTVALFLEGFGADGLPIIYMASSLMGSGLGFLYSWLQNNFPLKKVFVVIALLMSLPLLIFRVGIEIRYFNGFIALATVFFLRLWQDAEEILNDLNTQVAANQLFNIREIKRTYPIISSGLLMGDVIAGFSLPILLALVGLHNVMLVASIMILGGGAVLLFLSGRYKQAFPDTPVKDLEDFEPDYKVKKTPSAFQKYIIPLFAFFILGETLFLLVEFEYLGELEYRYQSDEIAGFLGLFAGFLGLCELLVQWFVSSRALEKLGVFVSAMLLPISLAGLGFITMMLNNYLGVVRIGNEEVLFLGVVFIKFSDELLRYTIIAGIEPFLFQPLPPDLRNSIQPWVQGVAEPISTGVTGVAILGGVWLVQNVLAQGGSADVIRQYQGGFFLGSIVISAIVWAVSAWLLRASYVTLLVQGAEQGRLGFSNVDLKAFKRMILESLNTHETEADQRSCIELLERIDPKNAGEVLAPMLANFSQGLQKTSLEAMLKYPDRQYLSYVEKIIEQKPNLEVLALALRYIWLSQPDLETTSLEPYLNDRVDALLRGTASGLILRQGTEREQQLAKTTLEKMLTSKRERERMIGAQTLQDVPDTPLIRQYISDLLQDESARVRCSLLEVIGKKQLPEYYTSLLKGLAYKSTRESAKRALIELGDHVYPLLIEFAEDNRKPDFVRLQAWTVLAEIGTPKALTGLVQALLSSVGATRRNLLRILLRVSEVELEKILDQFGRSSIETLIDQELHLLAFLHNIALDLTETQVIGQEADLLRSALQGMQSDILERCFLMLKLVYPLNAIQAALLNLDSDSQISIAVGLEILDNTIDIPQKDLFIELLEGGLSQSIESRTLLQSIIPYHPCTPSDRLRELVNLRHFLSEWTLSCCFHLARQQRWTINREATLVCLRHPNSIVRESVLGYLKIASPRICMELLPILQNDPNPLVADQVQQLQLDWGTS